MNVFITQEKIADTNVKSDFTSNNIQQKIIATAQQALPMLKDLKYGLIITNKDIVSGDLFGTIRIDLPSQKYNDVKTRISIPIFIKDFYMSPVDTIIINNAAFPITDNLVKELLQDPETFRLLKPKQINQSNVLSKLAEADPNNLLDSITMLSRNTDFEVYKILSLQHKQELEKHIQLQKNAEDFTEPVFECILEKRADGQFDFSYIKNDQKTIEYVTESITPQTANIVLNTLGYNTHLADKALQPGGVLLKAAVYKGDKESLPIDLKKVEKTKIVDSLKNGPVQIMLADGNLREGLLFDIVSFSSSANQLPEGKIFIDYKKNYCISAEFQGKSIDKDLSLVPDSESSQGTGVYVDHVNDIAFGPMEVMSYINSQNDLSDNSVTVKYKGKTLKLKKTPGLKKSVSNNDEIMIPEHYQWHNLNKKINIIDNVDGAVMNQIVDSSYQVLKHKNGGFQMSSIKQKTKTASIPDDKHLQLFFNRINLLADDLYKVAASITTETPLVFTTNYDMSEFFNTHKSTPTKVKSLDPIPGIDSYVQSIKLANEKTKHVFEELFELLRDPEFVTALNTNAEQLKDQMPEFALVKSSDAFETLDSIFSLNLINNANTAIFLSAVDKLKATLSTLAALRLYLRIGWNVSLEEYDVNQAIDGLNQIIRSLELLKTQKLLKNV